MPKGTHVGELDISWTRDILPPQFLVRYDYDLLYYLKTALIKLRESASLIRIVVHTVAEEIILYSIVKESEFLMESILPQIHSDTDDWKDWAFDIFDDMDVVACLYSDLYIDESNPYHFNHWKEEQFNCD